jgi:small subunit ribosomal protein S17e
VGKVRIASVKKMSRHLVALYPDRFGTDYEANKKAFEPLVDARTKRLRNRIVGYITRLKIVEQNRAAATSELGPEVSEEEQ